MPSAWLTSTKLMNRLIFVLGLLGMVVAAYVLQGWLRHASILCLTGGGCELVRKSYVSYPLGIPVPLVGLVGYTVITILAFLRTASKDAWISKALLGMTIFGICFVSWFTAMEFFVIKAVCTWCAVSAVNMYVIFLLLMVSYKQRNA